MGFTTSAALVALFRNENLATSGKVAPAGESLSVDYARVSCAVKSLHSALAGQGP
jgi:hypothetical protein